MGVLCAKSGYNAPLLQIRVQGGMALLSDNAKKAMIIGPTAVLPKPLRVPLRKRLLGKLEVDIARRSQLLIIAHPKSGNTWLKVMLTRLYGIRHGIAPEEAEEVFANKPLFRKTKKGHYVVFGQTLGGRYLTVVFELKPGGIARPITGWDMDRAEIRYYKKNR